MPWLPNGLAQIALGNLGIRHHFAGGVYAREQTLEAGKEVEKHVHNYDHLSYLASGSALLDIDGELQVLKAPCMLEVKAGKKHSIRAITDLVWLCIHAESVADAETMNKE